jgi:hypothetical protein
MMAKNDLKRILNGLSGAEAPDDVRRMAEDLAADFARSHPTRQHKLFEEIT